MLSFTARRAGQQLRMAGSCYIRNAAMAPRVQFFSSLPEHTVLTMPALSPTMESGTIASWTVEEGGEILAGNPVLEVETDKATVDYEAQDDGFLAKILLPEGTADVQIGTPIGIVVEEKSDIAAFADYKASDAPAAPAAEEASSAPAPTPTPAPEPEPAAPEPKATESSPVAPIVEKQPETAPSTPQPEQPVQRNAVEFPKFNSPLKEMLDKSREEYESEYGHTLMRRVVAEEE